MNLKKIKMQISSKKAFTMIELVFVIVVIGILAAIAVPKMAATRDDATITKAIATIGSVRSAIAHCGESISSDQYASNTFQAPTIQPQRGNGTKQYLRQISLFLFPSLYIYVSSLSLYIYI